MSSEPIIIARQLSKINHIYSRLFDWLRQMLFSCGNFGLVDFKFRGAVDRIEAEGNSGTTTWSYYA